MNIIRTASLGIALAMGLATGALAQGGGRRGGGGGGVERLLKGITLTDAQQTQVKEIQAKYAPQMQEMRQKMREARQSGGQMDTATMASMRDVMSKEHAEIRAVLTPEQQAKFDENVKNMPRGRGGPPSGQ